MLNKLIPSALVLCASALLPSAVSAQPVVLGDESVCDKFGWLVGTWDSYSPWGDQTQPTGGTLVFSAGPGGSAIGRIGTLNQAMEDSGYSSGMVVFRGFSEVYFYGESGSTLYQSFDGEFLQVDVDVSEWRSDTIGVAQNGHLYLTPPALSHLSGHGPFRKSAGAAPGEPCGPEPAQPSEEVPAQVSETALLREILDAEDDLPPVILNPDPCDDDDLPRGSLDEVMQEWDDDTALVRRLEAERALDAVRYPLLEMLDSLIFALMFEPVPERRVALKEQGDELRDILRRIDDEYVSEATAPAQAEEQRTPRECIIKTDTVLIDLERRSARRQAAQAGETSQPGDQTLDVVSVRNDVQGLVPGLFYGESDDERAANLRDLAQRLRTMADDDPSRSELQRNFDLRFDRLEQEYNAARELLRQSELTDEQRGNYRKKFNQLAEQMVENSGALGVERAMRLLAPDEFDALMRGDVYDIIEPWEEAGRTQGRTAEELANSRAGQRVQAALDRAFPQGWSYDHKNKLIEPSPSP